MDLGFFRQLAGVVIRPYHPDAMTLIAAPNQQDISLSGLFQTVNPPRKIFQLFYIAIVRVLEIVPSYTFTWTASVCIVVLFKDFPVVFVVARSVTANHVAFGGDR